MRTTLSFVGQAEYTQGIRRTQCVFTHIRVALQVMTYKHLFELLPVTCGLAHLTKFFHLLHLDSMQPLSASVQQHACRLGLVSADKADVQPASLSVIAEQLQRQISGMPSCSLSLKVRYIWQADCEVLGEIDYQYDHDWLMFRLQQHMGFWEGTWTPQVVSQQDTWKCRHCLFWQMCPTGRRNVQL